MLHNLDWIHLPVDQLTYNGLKPWNLDAISTISRYLELKIKYVLFL